jgi:acyl-coenzyme A thioesterase 13
VALQSPAGYLRSGVTATLADQLGSAVFFGSGLPRSGVSVEINVSFVDVATVGVRPALFFFCLHILGFVLLW